MLLSQSAHEPIVICRMIEPQYLKEHDYETGTDIRVFSGRIQSR